MELTLLTLPAGVDPDHAQTAVRNKALPESRRQPGRGSDIVHP
jgi:hypothetical protein